MEGYMITVTPVSEFLDRAASLEKIIEVINDGGIKENGKKFEGYEIAGEYAYDCALCFPMQRPPQFIEAIRMNLGFLAENGARFDVARAIKHACNLYNQHKIN